MSPRKLTENDKQEILEQYRTSQATTSTLAKSYEVSSSTISRFLKNKLSSAEYEDLIQQKRLARTPRGEKSAKKAKNSTKTTKTSKQQPATEEQGLPSLDRDLQSSEAKPQPEEVEIATDVATDNEATPIQISESVPETAIATSSEPEPESKPTTIPRRRRRSAAVSESTPETINDIESPTPQLEPEQTVDRLVLDKKVVNLDESETSTSDKPAPILKEDANQDLASVEEISNLQQVSPTDATADDSPLSQRLILKSDRAEPEPEDDDDDVDLITLKEMLGEDLEDFNDEDDEDDDEDWEDDDISYPTGSSLSDVKILPLSQASFPRTCYLVIDRAAELIVKPLSEFADLGVIPQEENREKTLPVFDNHRIAKRFSHRRERIIKVPDGRMLQKTSRYLQDKGITRLLIDGQIYSLI